MEIHNLFLNTIDITRLETRIDDQRTEYQMTDEGSLRLCKYLGDYRALSIPEKHGNISISSISSKAFEDNEHVKTIILTKNIIQIDDEAFNGMDHVTIFTPYLQDEVDFSRVQNVSIRYGLDNVVAVKDVFYACFSDLTAIIFDHDLLKRQFDRFGRFGEHIQLESMIDGKYTVDMIKSFTFMNAINLKNVDFPSRLKEIGFQAFCNCEKLHTISLPPLLLKVQDRAFERCLNLRKIVIPDSVDYIGKDAFMDVHRAMVFMEGEHHDALWNADWNPEKLPVIKRFGVFLSKDKVSYALTNDRTAVVIDNYLDDITKVVIPSQIKLNNLKYLVTQIGPFAFEGSKYLIGCILPKSISTIHALAFAGSNLLELKIPDSVETIGRGICADCIFMKKVILGEGILKIWDAAFANCLSLESVHIPQTVVEIGSGAFIIAVGYPKFEFPFFLKEVRENAFNGTSLTYVELGESIQSVGESAFEMIETLSTMVILNENVHLDDHLMSENVIVNFYIAGDEHSKLHERLRALVPDDKKIYWAARKVQEVEGVKYLLNWFDQAWVVGYNAELLEEHVTIPEKVAGCTVTRIEPRAFQDAKRLKTLVIGESVVYLGDGFLEGCSHLRECTIPAHLNHIKARSLTGTKNLQITITEKAVEINPEEVLFRKLKFYLDEKKTIDFEEIQKHFGISENFAKRMIKRYTYEIATDTEILEKK